MRVGEVDQQKTHHLPSFLTFPHEL